MSLGTLVEQNSHEPLKSMSPPEEPSATTISLSQGWQRGTAAVICVQGMQK